MPHAFTSIAATVGVGAVIAACAPAWADPAVIDWQPVGTFAIARTETTVAQFGRFVAATGTVTRAEHDGGGSVYEAGWTQKPGWTWRTPFGGGRVAGANEPAVHVTWDEAQAFCRWAGGRLPTDAQWVSAAYTEQRTRPPPPFERGRTYPFPTGMSAAGAQCLGDCGAAAQARAIAHGALLSRGHGHAAVDTTPAGVNGLHDMGGNVWEWVDDPVGATGSSDRLTRGGSWWYGQAQTRAGHRQSKPADTRVVYIGFRCVRAD